MIHELPALILLGICLLLSFTLSGMEAGVFALNRLRVRRLARAGNASARRLHGYLESPEQFLWTILVGNALVNFLTLGWALTRLYEHFIGHPGVLIGAFAALVFVFYVFFDLLPKMLFRAYPNQLCLVASYLFRFVHLGLAPLVFGVEAISRLALRWHGTRTYAGRLFGNREEMRAVMAEAAQALTREEHAMVNRVLDLQNFLVAQITVPAAKLVAVETGWPLRRALALAREKNHSRLPVWETRGAQRRIVGVLDVGALLYEEKLDWDQPLTRWVAPALYLEDHVRLEVALRRMQRAGQRLAIVLGRDGREAGIVSLEDILRIMFGEVKL